MKKFKNFINEKITKKEFDTALDNLTINAGCEFEFFLNDFTSSDLSDLSDKIDEIDYKITQAQKEVDDINKNMEDYFDKYQEEQEKYENAEHKISELEHEISELEDEISELEDENEESDITKPNKTDVLYDKIEDIKSDISDLQDIIDIWQNGDIEENLLYRYEPIPSEYNLSRVFNIIEYLEDDIGLYLEKNTDISDILFKYFEDYYVPDVEQIIADICNFNIQEFLRYPEEYIGSNQELPDEYQLKNDFNFPVKIENGWEIKEDGSLADGGIEISTGIYQVGDLVDIIEKVFKWIDKYGYTDRSTGFHVHLSCTKNQIDPLKLLLFTEEGRIYKDFQERIGNRYAESILKGHLNSLDTFNKEDLIKLSKKEKIENKFSTEKYRGVHLIDLDHNHVEFRYLGGKDYHTKFNEIKEVIAYYSYWISLACDPEFKKQEYIKKVNRLNNKLSTSFYNQILIQYDELSKVYKDLKNFKQIQKKIAQPYINKISKSNNNLLISDKMKKAAKRVAEQMFNDLSLHYGKKGYKLLKPSSNLALKLRK